MDFPLSSLFGLILIAFSMFALNVFRLEGKIIGLLLLYLGGILLLWGIVSYPILYSLGFVGISNAVVLAAGHVNFRRVLELPQKNSETLFYLIRWLLWGIVAYAAESKIKGWLPLPDSVLLAVIFIMLSSLMIMTSEQDLLNAFLCLQCVFFAFELVYLLLEGSVLIFVCLTGISMLISLVGAFINLPEKKPDFEDEDIL